MGSGSVLVLFSLICASQQIALQSSKLCKPLSTSDSWPSAYTWQAFNTSISGTLLAAVPPAIVCDTARPHSYDRTACARVGEGWLRSSFHSDDPVSVAYPNWQDDACLPTAISNSSTSCDVRPFPEYVVNASDATHVAEAIRFASKTRVRLIVKGGAHDLLGRSTAPSSLSIWTRHILGMTYHSSFSPASCPGVYASSAITASSGHRMGEIYTKAAAYNMTIVGSADPNVGLGGYLTGGGHSPIGTKYGLGVDNVLELSVVTPDGSLRTANTCLNPDLFWAMKGFREHSFPTLKENADLSAESQGGGSTFGVLINATLKTHAIPTVTSAVLEFNSTLTEATQYQNINFISAAAYFHTQLPFLSSAGLMGYYSITPSVVSAGPGPLYFAFLVYGLSSSPSALQKALQPIVDRLLNTSGITSSQHIQPTTDFLAFQATLLPAASVGTNYLAGSRLWDEKAVQNEQNMQKTLQAFRSDYLEGTFVSGVGVQSIPSEQSSVNPAWRRTIVHMMTKVTYPLKSTPATVLNARRVVNTLTKSLRDQAPDMGCYVNEADIDEPNYQQAFWGDHYDRLLQVKQQIDPLGVFWCKVCVGGEYWTVEPDGRICRL